MVSIHAIHMKRTNLVLNGELLDEARRLSGEKTYSATVDRALEDFVRRAKAGRILELEHSGEWQGDLAEMRGDRTATGRGRRGSR
jgi:Arc/MetJ family transcription regulator